MQIPIISHRGQKKPWNSIPRINWMHPLAADLVTYCYDAGSGPIELVGGGIRKITNAAEVTYSGRSPFGGGLKYVSVTNALQANAVNMPISNAVSNIATNFQYSFSCAIFLTLDPNAGNCLIYGAGDTAGNSGFAAAMDATGGPTFLWGNGSFTTASGTTNNFLNLFTTIGGTSVSASTGQGYVNGAPYTLFAGQTTQFTLTNGSINFVGQGSGTAVVAQSSMGGFIFYGAAWTRQLSLSEHRKLHDDPYCFLIYPEDEIFSTLVGTTAQVAVPVGFYGPLEMVGRKVYIIGTG